MIRQALIDVAAAVILGIATSTLAYAMSYVRAKFNNEKVDAAMTRLTNTTQTVVDNLTQTIVSDIKKNGMFGPKSSEVVGKHAFDTVMRQVPTATLKTVETAVKDFPEFLRLKVEQAVLKGKSQYTFLALAAPPPKK